MTTRRSSTTRSLVWLRDSLTPMFVVNSQHRVVLFNHGCETSSGWPAAEVLGQKALSLSNPDDHTVEALLAAMNPPDVVWQGQAARCRITWPHQRAAPESRVIQFWPIRGTDADGLLAILGIIELEPPWSANLPVPDIFPSLSAELSALRYEHRRRFGEKSVIGRCPAMLRVLTQAQLARQTRSPVCLRGEPGTGKEHLARSIHQTGMPATATFQWFDCRLTPTNELKLLIKRALETESRPEKDDAPTITTWYLNDIDAAPADLQERLLTLLQRSSNESTVRVIAATSAPIETLIAEDVFSRDMWYCLSALTIELPPLRERGTDIKTLGQFFVEQCNRNQPQHVNGVADDVWTQWERYRWPGNLDEFRKVVEEAHAACTTGQISLVHLPFRFRAGQDAQRLGPVRVPSRGLDQILEETERNLIQQALADTQNHITQTAEWLQIPRARLYRRMDQLGLRTPDSSGERLDSDPAKPPS
ncbi:PAS domain-containing protein [bacterium]|nr:PAS domain-containing protein [bacterium]